MKVRNPLVLIAVCGAFGAWGSVARGQQPAAPALTTQRLADKSGSIGVAPGWKITSSANGAVSMAGPNGAMLNLGIPTPVVVRGVERQFPGVPVVFPGVLRADFTDPVRAYLDVASAVGQKVGGHTTRLKTVETLPWQNGKAAYIRVASIIKGVRYESFGLYAIMPVDGTSGIFYFSEITAPASVFDKQYPAMMAMWQSWSLSPALVRERLASAAKALAEVDVVGTMDSVMRHRREVAEEAAAKWDAYIRQ